MAHKRGLKIKGVSEHEGKRKGRKRHGKKGHKKHGKK